MMNLDLLFTVSKWTGDNKYKDVAIKHAITTMKNHFRPDERPWLNRYYRFSFGL